MHRHRVELTRADIDTFNAAMIAALSGCCVASVDGSGGAGDVGDALRFACRVAGRKVAQDGFDGLGAVAAAGAPALAQEPMPVSSGQKRKDR